MIGPTPKKYGDELPADGWEEFFCAASADVKILVRKAKGGEEVGHSSGHHRATVGDNLCLLTTSGHRWTMTDDALHEFYVPKSGRLPQKKEKKTATRKKGPSQHVASSWFSEDDPLFNGCGEEGDSGDGTPDEKEKA